MVFHSLGPLCLAMVVAVQVYGHTPLVRRDALLMEQDKRIATSDDGASVAETASADGASSTLQECGHPLLLSGHSLDMVVTFWTDQPEPTSTDFLKGTSSSHYANLVYMLRSAERHGLLQHVRTVHILMDENVVSRDGAPHALAFNRSDSSESPLNVKLVMDRQIGVNFHQSSAKFSAISKIPGIADWILYMPGDMLLMDDFSMDDFWDRHTLKPKMYAYDQSSAGWCDNGAPVGSFHGPVLVNRCFLDQVAKKYSETSYLPHSWEQNQKRNFEAVSGNIDSICLYTKSVLEEGMAVSGGTPTWNRQCLMGDAVDAHTEACSPDELLGIPLQTPRFKFIKVQDAKLGKAAKDLGGSQGTDFEEEQTCDQVKTQSFFHTVAGSTPMSFETSTASPNNDTKAWDDLLCLSNPIISSTLSKFKGENGSNYCAAAMIVMLTISLLGLIWVQRSRLRESSRTEMLASGSVLIYMGLTIVVDILIRKFHQQGVDSAFKFKPSVVVLFIEIGKLAVNGVCALVDWRRTRECSMSDFSQTVRLMLIPAACYVVLNLGRYLSLSLADLDEYRVFRSTDILFVALIWFFMLRKKLNNNQYCGIMLVFCACALMHGQAMTLKSMLPALAIIGIAFCSSLGLVFNELGLKANANLSIFIQNIALYVATCSVNICIVFATVPMSDIFQGIEWPQLLLIVLDILLGVCVSCVLKYANAMVKQLASGWLTALEPLMGHFVVGTMVTPVMVLSTMLAGAGSIAYRLEPAALAKTDESK